MGWNRASRAKTKYWNLPLHPEIHHGNGHTENHSLLKYDRYLLPLRMNIIIKQHQVKQNNNDKI